MSTAESPPRSDPVPPLRLVVMGVSGSGKSTVAAEAAGRLGAVFIDGDDLHPAANVEKMRGGEPLTDDDRWPWLDRIAEALNRTRSADGGLVVACSALRRAYRDRLRAGTGGIVRFAFLHAGPAVIEARLLGRLDHFMPRALLESQFATLEVPAPDEADVLTLDAERPAHEIAVAVAESFAVGGDRRM